MVTPDDEIWGSSGIGYLDKIILSYILNKNENDDEDFGNGNRLEHILRILY